jgi:hypothetical protein
MVATALGYTINNGEALAGGYPDIRHQALEVKVQDSATVDLGMYSPQFEVEIPNLDGITTKNVRYLIALTNSSSGVIEGIILCAGQYLSENFSYVADKSYKCQRSIPMNFFDKIIGKVVINPTSKR